jgi:hypothetical protein
LSTLPLLFRNTNQRHTGDPVVSVIIPCGTSHLIARRRQQPPGTAAVLC